MHKGLILWEILGRTRQLPTLRCARSDNTNAGDVFLLEFCGASAGMVQCPGSPAHLQHPPDSDDAGQDRVRPPAPLGDPSLEVTVGSVLG